ncbi:hypothetical protein QRO11_21055 [Paracidovorax citrulli]|uniref:hypothetical protein n=1 Tax=Paracidovorax citrulli TaxID=80869 RepID=UPI00088984FF|nr:hypothetical protein [Paracidovorax citrulli]QCX11082.1 hypothetical protein APS58_2251 [Paracidovorax citrulli]UEG45947.1 hypothetical protein LKW27_20235 [Paracidovorax citrulli]UMT86760.1 hypothetical protein FRC90_01040 [Paracidovorax citrulli]UMT94801.1 hypothetical protein FRC97_07220 [Paracidovorax citrulli]WIY34402.1 hypothetical protein QRO11_21055 [Paracidovorax citrulli]
MTGQVKAATLDALTPMVQRAEKLSLLLLLIERATSIAVVRDFLKSRGLQHSAGSWEDLRTKRILPAYDEGKISLADLQELLRRTEGYGRQHVFLFRCPADRAALLLADDRMQRVLNENNISDVGFDPLVVDLPDQPTFVDVRTAVIGGVKSVSIKEIEKRTSKKLTSEVNDAAAMTLTKVYSYEHQRVINLVRLWANGLLEVRIASRDNSTKYKDDLGQFFYRLRSIFPRTEFKEVSLSSLKKNLWEKRVELQSLVKFSTYTLRDDEGMTLRANTAVNADDLADSERIAKSLAEFDADTTYCADSNVYFKIADGEEVLKEIHVLLNGEDNEFAVTAAITEEEYEFVLHQVLENN